MDARPEDWQRGPCTLLEENGSLFGRGTIDTPGRHSDVVHVVAEFLRFPDEDAMLFLTSTDAMLTATPVVEVLEPATLVDQGFTRRRVPREHPRYNPARGER